MHDQVDDNVAEERGFELLSFLELFGPDGSPFPARGQVVLKLTIPDVPDLYSRQQRYCRIPPDRIVNLTDPERLFAAPLG